MKSVFNQDLIRKQLTRIMKKKIVALFMATALMLFVAAVASSESAPALSSDPVAGTTYESAVLTPIDATKAFSLNLNGDRIGDNDVVVTSDALPYLKVYAYNTSSVDMIVLLTKDSPSGPVMGMMTVKPGRSNSMQGETVPTGTYYVGFSNNGADTLKGTASCKIASSFVDL